MYNQLEQILNFIIIISFIVLAYIVYKYVYLSGYYIEQDGEICDIQKRSGEQKIPKIIIQTWKNNKIPEKYRQDLMSVKEKNPDYTIMFFTDDDIESFFQDYYPEYYSTYKNLPITIQKIDFFRYVAIYHYGGFYFDLDMTCMYCLDDLLYLDCIFPVDTFIYNHMCPMPRYRDYCKNNCAFLLGQYAFAAKPRHPFIKKLIDEIHNNISHIIREHKNINKKDKQKLEHFVYKTTGPDFVTDIYLSWDNKKDISILKHNENQYFGIFAKHNYYGTWK